MRVQLHTEGQPEGVVLPTRPDVLWVSVDVERRSAEGRFTVRDATIRTLTKTGGWHKQARHAYGDFTPTAEERALLLAAALPRYAELCRSLARQERRRAERYEEDATAAELLVDTAELVAGRDLR